jgi:4-hydroxymandelate oxidase
MSQTLMMLSTSSHCSLEDVAKVATGPLWFQLYHRGHDVTNMLVQRAEQAGYKAIVLTVDTPLPAPKERDLRNCYENPFPLANFRAMPEDLPALRGTDEAHNWQPARVPALTWNELDWLRSLTTLPLVLKGIRTAEDAHMAVDCGVNDVLVSTHGGRQMDATLSADEPDDWGRRPMPPVPVLWRPGPHRVGQGRRPPDREPRRRGMASAD